jgi:hypothetical protein
MLSRSSDHAEALAPDPLSEVLRDLRPSGVSYGHCRLSRPWGVAFAAEPSARLHFVVAGESYLRTADFGPVRLTAGDVALVPQGVAHAMTDTPRGRTKPLSAFPLEEIGDRTYRMAAGGGGSQTLMAPRLMTRHCRHCSMQWRKRSWLSAWVQQPFSRVSPMS